MGQVAEFTDAGFESDVLQATEPVLVDFWAPWCAPCRTIAPLIEQIAAENEGIKVGKVNVDHNNETAIKYHIEAIPTLMIFKGGEVVERMLGVPTKSRVQEAIDQAKG
jgi:thioredoxin 1